MTSENKIISDSLYFGDSTHRNTLVRGHIGGVSGGRIYMTGRHVDIDGEITVDGQPPENQLGANAGLYNIWIVFFFTKIQIFLPEKNMKHKNYVCLCLFSQIDI